MTTRQTQTASPTLTTTGGLHRRDYEGRISTLCAGCGHDSISAAIIQACWSLTSNAPRGQALGHWLHSNAGLLSGRLARLQHSARPHALGADRCQPRQRDLLYWACQRRRLCVHRLGQFANAMRRGVCMLHCRKQRVYG